MKNLLEGVELPVADNDIKRVCDLLVQRLKDHKDLFEIERSAPQALLATLRERCTHPGVKRGYNERDGSWMARCHICGHSE